jgi:4-oxalocrotonate tautomerase
MPHIVVKMYAGRSEEKKRALADALSKAMIESIGVGAESISMEIMEYAKEDWPKKVYKPEILDRLNKLSIKPGYRPSDEELGV